MKRLYFAGFEPRKTKPIFVLEQKFVFTNINYKHPHSHERFAYRAMWAYRAASLNNTVLATSLEIFTVNIGIGRIHKTYESPSIRVVILRNQISNTARCAITLFIEVFFLRIYKS